MSIIRKPGISVLITTQNEEPIVSLCVRSFLDFGDEIIVVDNGSKDKTKEIILNLQKKYPNKIKFYEKPEFVDVYQNSQFAFKKSVYQWVFRCDADYVAYTDGPNSIFKFKEWLLSRPKTLRPYCVFVFHYNVLGDFFHTGTDQKEGNFAPKSPPMARFYQVFPFFKFKRTGRWYGVRFKKIFEKITYQEPLWLHCNLKSDLNYLFRSERTNWREMGDFNKFPTLKSYLNHILFMKFGTKNIDQAAKKYLQNSILSQLQLFDEKKYIAYPKLVSEQIKKNPIFRIRMENNNVFREYLGPS